MDKPIKPIETLAESFGGIKENFSQDKIETGYEPDIPDILGGANLNYLLDTVGKKFKYNDAISDYINNLSVGKTPIIDVNNKLSETEIGLKVYNADETFSKNEWVVGFVDDEKGIYKSLINGNTGNALTNTTAWEKVELGGGIDEDDLFEIPVIIERYVGENSWYDLYSDGLCVQGGKFTYVSNGTITLLQTYRDVNYYVQLTDVDEADTGGVSASTAVASLTENTITLSTTSEANYIYWTTRGYVA